MINQCSSCGGFCKKSGCERENVKPKPQLTWAMLTDEEIKSCWNWETDCQEWAIEFAHAIEAKLKDKNR